MKNTTVGRITFGPDRKTPNDQIMPYLLPHNKKSVKLNQDIITKILETFIRNFIELSEDAISGEVLNMSLRLKDWYCLKSTKEKYDLANKIINLIENKKLSH